MSDNRDYQLRQAKESRQKRLRHILYSAVCSTVVFGLGLGLAFAFEVKDVSYSLPLQQQSSNNITLAANYLKVDIDAGIVVVDWYPLGYNCDPQNSKTVEIFFDPNLLLEDGGDDDPPPSDAPPDDPTFIFNTTGRCPPNNIRDSFATFRTQLKLTGDPGHTLRNGPSLQDYPFDSYLAQISIFARESETNATVAIVIGKTFGTPVNFKLKLDPKRSVNKPEGAFILLIISRSAAVKILAIIITLANWMITLVFIGITIAVFIFGNDVVAEMIAIPIGSLFAFSTVRANLPGAPPGFGAFIDYLGILPNLAIMTFCSAILIAVVLWRRITPAPLPTVLGPDREGNSDEKSHDV